jgi:hypothetical protein
MDNRKKAPDPEVHNDLLTTAAEAIGSTLGRLAVRVGIAKPPAAGVKPKPARKKKAPARKAAAKVSRKAVSKKKAAKAPTKRAKRS